MALANLLDYAYMAAASYGDDQADVTQRFLADPRHGHWAVADYQAGTPANGFQGAIFVSNREVICAYKGSKGGIRDKTTTGYDDWSVNDVQIALNRVPSQTPAALAFATVAHGIASGNKQLSLVGHSLGGGLAQLVGYSLQIPFVTFNAPGMRNNLPGVTWGSAHKVQGFNMILSTDPVGNFGLHIGKTERFLSVGALNPFGGAGAFAHVMKNVIATLQLGRNSSWADKKLSNLI